MIITEDERTITSVGKCENCNRTTIVRRVKTIGWSGEGRGWFDICFACFGPRVFWKERENGPIFESPAEYVRQRHAADAGTRV
jgi:hypothetical protein